MHGRLLASLVGDRRLLTLRLSGHPREHYAPKQQMRLRSLLFSCNAQSDRHTPKPNKDAATYTRVRHASGTFLGLDIVTWISSLFISEHWYVPPARQSAVQCIPIFANASQAYRTYKGLAAINVSPYLCFNHAVHRYPQFLFLRPWPLWSRLLSPLSHTPQSSPLCLGSID